MLLYMYVSAAAEEYITLGGGGGGGGGGGPIRIVFILFSEGDGRMRDGKKLLRRECALQVSVLDGLWCALWVDS